MGVSMATEQNGAGNQGAAWALWQGSARCRSRVMAGKGRGCRGSERGCSPCRWDGRCPSPSAGAAPEPAPSTHAPGPRRACDGQRCPVMPCRAVPRVPCRASKAARSRAFLPPLARLPSPLSLLPQGLSPSSPRQGLPYQACHPGYLIWVSRLPHPEKMYLRIPSTGTALPGVGGCCLSPTTCAASPCALRLTRAPSHQTGSCTAVAVSAPALGLAALRRLPSGCSRWSLGQRS